MIATYHNHSKWSDGTASVGELVSHAVTMGVDILGVSDHLCVYPDGTIPIWAMDPARVGDYFAEVTSFWGTPGIEVRVGLELDWLGRDYHGIRRIAERFPLDYRIGSVHHVEGQQFESSKAYWTEKSEDERNEVFRKYWGLVQEMAESRFFDIAAHLDLAKKQGFAPTTDVGPALDAALDAIAAAGMVVELNTSGYARPCAEPYPSPEILKKCRTRGIAVTLSADGHSPPRLLYEFERGLAALREAGFTSLARFREREKWFEPLDNALGRFTSGRLPG